MKNTTPILIGAIVLFLILAGVGYYAYTANQPKPMDLVYSNLATGTPSGVAIPPSIKSFAIQRPSFVVQGESLGRVEIWATIGGQQRLLGTLTRQPVPAKAGFGDTWTMPLPARIGASAIYARGYDKSGSPVARFDLPPAQVRGL